MAHVFLCKRQVPAKRGERSEVADLLEAAGHRVTQVGDGALAADSNDVVLVLGNARWFPGVVRWLHETPATRRSFVAVWHTEALPLPTGVRTRRHARELARVLLRDWRATDPATNYAAIRRLSHHGLIDLLVVGGPASREFLRTRGIAAEWAPLGYHPGHGRDLGVERDIDVLFLGSTDAPRRRRVLRQLRLEGVPVEVAGSWHDPRYWGEDRTRLLNRVRVLLNVARRPGELSGLRLMLGMANGALVVSEPIYDSAPYIAGRHYLSAPLDDLPATIAGVLADEESRARLARAGHRFATTEVTLERSVMRVMELVMKGRGR
jgi:hypothetical protein